MIDTSHFPTTRDPPREEPLPCSDPRARCTHNPPPPPPKPPIDCEELRKRPDPSNPTCNPPSPQPVKGRVINLQVHGDSTIITIARGSRDGITREWVGCVLVPSSDTRCMAGGDFVVVKVTEQSSIAKTKLTPDQVVSSGNVRLKAR